MNLKLNRKVIIVTGSTTGIGLGISNVLKEEGAIVIINSKSQASMDVALENNLGFYGYVCDSSNESGIKDLIRFAINQFGRIDSLVCNLGGGKSVPAGCESYEEYKRVFDLNFYSAVQLISLSKEYLEAVNGSIVCISSICGREALGAPITYSCAKSSLEAYVRNMSKVLSNSNIRLNSVAPGNIMFEGSTWDLKLKANEQQVMDLIEREVPLKRFGTPRDVGNIVAFLLSEVSSFITGATFVVDGGQLRAN